MELSIGILCGGKSRRMGLDKALLKAGNTTFLDRLLEEFNGFKNVYLSVRPEQSYEAEKAVYLTDENQNTGPIEGVRRILKESETEYVFICAVDMPFINCQTVEYLKQFINGEFDAYVMEDETGVHPLCGIYSRKMLPVLEKQIELGEFKIQNAFTKTAVKKVPIAQTPLSKDILDNVNTIKEYELCKFKM